MTTVINLFGGSGCGKSTTAAALFSLMKQKGYHVELVREYCKYWAWNDRKVREWDQLYLLGKQSAYESMLYGKVDFIVTDSPVLLAGIYQDYRSQGEHKYVGDAAKAFMTHAESSGSVKYLNFILKRSKPFDPRGRWETEEEARRIDKFVSEYLAEFCAEPPIVIEGPEEDRPVSLLSHVVVG